MNITFISHPYPWPLTNGGNLRRFHLIRQLATRHSVDLIALAAPVSLDNDGALSPLEEICRSVTVIDTDRLIPDRVRQRYNQFGPVIDRMRNLATWGCSTHAGPYLTQPVVSALREARQRVSGTVTWVDRSYIAEAARVAGFENMTVDVDDLLTTCHWRALRHFAWRPSLPQMYVEGLKLAWYERSLPRRFSRLVVCKEEDRQFLGNHHKNIFVVPNGMELAPPADFSLTEPGSMLFVAALDCEPNIDALSFFATKILPRIRRSNPGARLLMVGRNPDERSLCHVDGASVEIHGNVPSIEPYYKSSRVVVCPIRLGSGTKLKVLEALARGKAVVATAAAVEGLDLRPGIDFELADHPHEFANRCCELLHDTARCSRLGQAGRDRVAARFQWTQIAERAERALGILSAPAEVGSLVGA